MESHVERDRNGAMASPVQLMEERVYGMSVTKASHALLPLEAGRTSVVCHGGKAGG